MTPPPKVDLQDLLNAVGLGFEYLLTSLIATLLNAGDDPDPVHPATAIAICEKLGSFAQRPSAPMPVPVIASLLTHIGSGAREPRYVALILAIWQRPWNPKALADEIRTISK